MKTSSSTINRKALHAMRPRMAVDPSPLVWHLLLAKLQRHRVPTACEVEGRIAKGEISNEGRAARRGRNNALLDHLRLPTVSYRYPCVLNVDSGQPFQSQLFQCILGTATTLVPRCCKTLCGHKPGSICSQIHHLSYDGAFATVSMLQLHVSDTTAVCV